MECFCGRVRVCGGGTVGANFCVALTLLTAVVAAL